MNCGQKLSKLWFFYWGVLFAVSAGLSPIEASANAARGIAELVESRAMRYVLTQTRPGLALTERFLGRLSGADQDLKSFVDGLRTGQNLSVGALRRSTEQRLTSIEETFELKTGRSARALRLLSHDDRKLLDDLSHEFLKLEGGSDPLPRFAKLPAELAYAASQKVLLHGAKVRNAPFYSTAYPSTLWDGKLPERLARFEANWPSNVRIVDGVRFSFSGAGIRRSQERGVVVISQEGLAPEQVQDLIADYLNAVARRTLSFPLGEGPGHLYTRSGTQSVDWTHGSVDFTDYRGVGHGDRLEPVVLLSTEEEGRLVRYLDHMTRNGERGLGHFDMDGVASGKTRSKLTDNRPKRRKGENQEGHNCTSWMCTAPIGEEGQPLLELVGAKAANDFHTNPGWWASFLAGGAKAKRVPFIVYWTGNQPLEAALPAVKSGRRFRDWDYNRH